MPSLISGSARALALRPPWPRRLVVLAIALSCVLVSLGCGVTTRNAPDRFDGGGPDALPALLPSPTLGVLATAVYAHSVPRQARPSNARRSANGVIARASDPESVTVFLGADGGLVLHGRRPVLGREQWVDLDPAGRVQRAWLRLVDSQRGDTCVARVSRSHEEVTVLVDPGTGAPGVLATAPLEPAGFVRLDSPVLFGWVADAAAATAVPVLDLQLCGRRPSAPRLTRRMLRAAPTLTEERGSVRERHGRAAASFDRRPGTVVIDAATGLTRQIVVGHDTVAALAITRGPPETREALRATARPPTLPRPTRRQQPVADPSQGAATVRRAP